MTRVFRRNPDYGDRKPEVLEPACHDRTPMIDVRCDCGATSHIHESQIPEEANEIGMRCSACRRTLMMLADHLRLGFAQMRAEGWVAP